ncbi:hypothetical protein C8J56DRAFT_457797 [Mycena floridula]|nr:hypothetical protein C8J56DRAFT_457797 [Mycena floridula]
MHPATTPASPVMSSFPPSQSNNFSLMSSSPFLNHSNSRPSQIVVPAGYTLDFGPASAPSSPFEAYPPQLQRGSLEQQPSSRRPSFPQSSQDIDPVRHLLNSVHLSDKRTSSSSSTDSKLSQTSSSNSNLSLSSNNTTPPPDQTSSSPSSAPSGTHPNHPGHISIPSLPPVPFSMAMHNMSPVMMPMAYSPLYHPGNMSPMHHPGLVTPHGIPITPSMPPFTFASHLHPMPSPTMGSFPVSTPQPAPSTSNGSLNHENINNNNHQQGPSTPTHPGGPIPFTPFSPGIALSPGAFWAGGSGNPYINAAVGAPVHGGYQSFGPGTPTGGFYFAPSPAGMPPQMPMEPGGYFDNVFMMGSSMGMGALEGEIMKDKEPVVVDEEKKEKESTPNSDLGDRRGWEGRATEETEQSATKSATQTNSTPPSPMSKRPLVLRPESDPMKPTLFNHMTNSSE